MEVQIRDKSIKWTYISMVIAVGVFSFIGDMKGYPIMDLVATTSISVAVGNFYRYIKCRDKSNLVITIIMVVVFVVSTIRHKTSLQKWWGFPVIQLVLLKQDNLALLQSWHLYYALHLVKNLKNYFILISIRMVYSYFALV